MALSKITGKEYRIDFIWRGGEDGRRSGNIFIKLRWFGDIRNGRGYYEWNGIMEVIA